MARLSYTIRQLWESAGMLYTCMSDAVWFYSSVGTQRLLWQRKTSSCVNS
jgi:hypothetical protein